MLPARHTARAARRLRGSAACPVPAIRNKAAARAHGGAATPAVEAYRADNTASPGGYSGMTLSALQTIDAGVKGVTVVGTPSLTTYCIQTSPAIGGYVFRKNGPGADIEQ